MSKSSYYRTIDAYQNINRRIINESYQDQNKVSIPNQSIKMVWKTENGLSPSDPNVWGPAFWFTLHNGAVKYPDNASDICKERMKNFILGMPVMIPCEVCADHATAHIESNYHRLDEIVSTRTNLFNFFVDFHNYVNKRYNKPIMSYEDAYKLYTSPVSVAKLKYTN